jgi:hypothetical protein
MLTKQVHDMPNDTPEDKARRTRREKDLKETARMVRDLRKYRDLSWQHMGFEPGPEGTGIYTQVRVALGFCVCVCARARAGLNGVRE